MVTRPTQSFAPLALALLLGGSLLAGQAVAADADKSAQARLGTVTPTAFATKAAEGGLAEVQLAELARQQASSDAVKRFADRMITDHGKANTELEALARARNMTLPKTLNAEHKATLKSLQGKKGAEFDAAYMAAMKRDHVKDIALFEAATGPGFKDDDLKAFATKTLPVLQEHHQLVESTQGQLRQAQR